MNQFQRITGFSEHNDEDKIYADEDKMYGIAILIDIQSGWMTYYGSCFYIMRVYNATLSFLDMADNYNIIWYELDDNLAPIRLVHSLTFTGNQAVKVGNGGSVKVPSTIGGLTVVEFNEPFNLKF